MVLRMRQQIRELAFRPLDFSDESFAAALSRHVFASWSRDPVRTLSGMLRSEGAIAEVATSGEERLGFFVVSLRRLKRPFGPIQSPVTAHLDAIAVVPRAAGKGVGRALLNRAERRALAHGAVVMSLTTAIGNTRAQRLFARDGFLRTMKTTGAYANEEDAYEMFKAL
jgi:ribosomal protein S18 acetylase RimI-like enzyme